MKNITLSVFAIIVISFGIIGTFGFSSDAHAQSFCYTFNSDLRVGSTGTDVDALHTILSREGFTRASNWSTISPSNTFTEETASLVSGFQEKYRSEILSPLGFRFGTGFVGQQTRNKLNALYSCGGWNNGGGTNNSAGIVVQVSANKSAYSPFEDIYFTITARNTTANDRTLNFSTGCQTSYRVGTFDSANSQACTLAFTSVRIPAFGAYTWNVQHNQNTHRLSSGTYTLTGRVIGVGEANTTIMISDSNSGGWFQSNDLRLISPNGGQWLRSGSTQTITWQMPYVQYFAARSTDIRLVSAQQTNNQTISPIYSCPIGSTCAFTGNTNMPFPTVNTTTDSYSIARGVYGTTFNWIVGTTANFWSSIPAGSYFMEICESGTTICDRSDNVINII